MLSEQQQNFLNLAKEMEAKQKEVNDLREKLEASMQELGLGNTFQDPATGVVYRVAVPKGTFMYYRHIDYVRTAIGDERAGTLSKKDAEAAGFVLQK